MVFPRRLHARPTRRRQLVYTTLAFLAVMFYLFRWNPSFSPGGRRQRAPRTDPALSKSGSTDRLDTAATDSEDRGGLPLAELLSGNPPRWRDPRRDFQAEYDEVVAAVPGLAGGRPARFAFLIMAHGPSDVKLLRRNLPWLYSPLNFFLVGGKEGLVGLHVRRVANVVGARWRGQAARALQHQHQHRLCVSEGFCNVLQDDGPLLRFVGSLLLPAAAAA